MTSLVSSPPIPCELDHGVDDADLPSGHVWAYSCKLPLCPDYGKSWKLRSNCLLHLQERVAHGISAKTPAVRRAIEIGWRYTTDPYLLPRAALDFRSWEDPDEHVWDYSFKDNNGRVITGRGTQKQIEVYMAPRCLLEEGILDA